MKHIDYEKRVLLEKLKYCEPNQVGKILKEYFNKLKEKNKQAAFAFAKAVIFIILSPK